MGSHRGARVNDGASERRGRSAAGLAAVFASTCLGLVSLFMFFPLLLFTLKGRGWSDAAVGGVASVEWLGLAVGAPFVSGWVRRMGLRRAFLLSGLLPFCAYLGITLTDWPALWAVLIFGGGIAGSMRWIVAEASVAEMAAGASRGRTVGLFGTMISLTYIAGPALLAAVGTEGDAAERSRWTAVAIGGLGVLMGLRMPELHSHHQAEGAAAPRLGWRGIVDALRIAPLLLIAGALGGFYEAGSTGVLPLYGLALGLGSGMAALLVSACGLGGMLTMAPTGWLADRWPHRRLYLLASTATALASLAMPLVPWWPPLAYVIAMAWGGTGGALYTLAMADAGARGTGVTLVNFTAVLVMSYTLGGVVAPLLGGLALSFAPGWGLPLLMTAVACAGVVAVWRNRW
ncbi:MAG TPA: MFS transporter [Ideonella sp.]|jgi:MFS family permease|nr:MFS transporter [Ideonella sp.]